MEQKRKIIGVDVDLTVVNPVPGWLSWYKSLTGHELTSLQEFNLEHLMTEHHDPMEFWKNPKLYDDLIPIENSVESLKKIKELGYDIVFVSHCYPEHFNSKKLFLKRNFPFADGFVDTADKRFVQCDIFIDDYKKYLRQVKEYNSNCWCIQIESQLNSKGEFLYGNWNDILKAIEAAESMQNDRN